MRKETTLDFPVIQLLCTDMTSYFHWHFPQIWIKTIRYARLEAPLKALGFFFGVDHEPQLQEVWVWPAPLFHVIPHLSPTPSLSSLSNKDVKCSKKYFQEGKKKKKIKGQFDGQMDIMSVQFSSWKKTISQRAAPDFLLSPSQYFQLPAPFRAPAKLTS